MSFRRPSHESGSKQLLSRFSGGRSKLELQLQGCPKDFIELSFSSEDFRARGRGHFGVRVGWNWRSNETRLGLKDPGLKIWLVHHKVGGGGKKLDGKVQDPRLVRPPAPAWRILDKIFWGSSQIFKSLTEASSPPGSNVKIIAFLKVPKFIIYPFKVSSMAYFTRLKLGQAQLRKLELGSGSKFLGSFHL